MSAVLSYEKYRSRATGPLLALAGGAYLAVRLRTGWVPWDEGSLALAAERVVLGELPHRDFQDLYTGGLSFLNAAAFRMLGIDLVSPRIVLLVAFVAWLMIFYVLCSRFLPEWMSALVMGLVVVWSVPSYPAAVPSWYNLFLATGGLLAIMAFSDTGRMRWVWVAGLCTGLSIGMKIVGVFVALGAFVFLLFYEQTAGKDEAATTDGKSYSLLIVLFSSSVILSLTHLVSRVGSPAQVFRFIAPLGAVVLVLVVEEIRRPHWAGGVRSRCRTILVPSAFFLGGVAIPLLILSLPYLFSGAMTDLLEGVFIRPSRRFEFATKPAPPMLTIVFTIAVAGVLYIGQRIKPSLRWFHYAVVALIGTSVLVAAPWSLGAYMFVLLSAYNATPIVIMAGCIWVAFTEAPDHHRRHVFALLSFTAGVAMVGFPFSSNIYFHYSVALIILTLAALLWRVGGPRLGKVTVVIPWAFYLAFGLLIMYSHRPGAGGPRVAGQKWVELALPRARLRTSRADSALYGELVRVIGAQGDRTLGYAGPDAPEVYFLTQSRTTDPILFDFLSAESGSPLDDPEFLRDSDLVVLNHRPGFSNPLRPSTLQRVASEFPFSATIGSFEVRWRE